MQNILVIHFKWFLKMIVFLLESVENILEKERKYWFPGRISHFPTEGFFLRIVNPLPHNTAFLGTNDIVEEHCEKRRNCLEQAISPFLTVFSTLYDTYFSF